MKINLEHETWVNNKWRPMMAWTYMAICIFDFMVAPTFNYVFFAILKGGYIPWQPLTMTSGGLFHVAMGAIVGITSWQRGTEKIKMFSKKQDDEPR